MYLSATHQLTPERKNRRTHALRRNSAGLSDLGERKWGELDAAGSKLETSTKKLKESVRKGAGGTLANTHTR
jgi:hypothetical protein